MKIYTKTGDSGETSLFGGGRVQKNDKRVTAYGEIDELNSFVGALLANLGDKSGTPHYGAMVEIRHLLEALQNRLFDLGAELAVGDQKFLAKLARRIAEPDIAALEAAIDRMQAHLKPLTNFILPGGSPAAAHAHICRSVSRRAERAMIAAAVQEPLLLSFINRLSDYFFVLARYLNHLNGVAEPEWEK
ncbi:cob(I)yrinic acid a,c-diamide adenosyltransferase [Turneriella parva]|uniref:Corrinoid adenosyltransferase n=1 Tax=Turneriella parva (strain ATCC BAA-1111 / DSM 21527 / NCTC 11395 / H) TaxID=869212 RepID=I4B8Z0_TURPD|nr:cob(I)yrinic acid a,c-diamide adenosyltransferase [Turneriella parva]AFM13747.1 ATP/cobalamin adenosyltransferase [Turneriella parva DSM 21527]